jgi:hypothetical protein
VSLYTSCNYRKNVFFKYCVTILVVITYLSNVVVIIVRIVLISSFLFYCLLSNHSFPTNPNSSTNCFQLILFCVTTLQTTFAQCVRLFLIFETGASRGMHRITVRQLEAMVRLSEALARLHLVDEVTPGMVKEAFKLLRKSIVTVQYDDVDLAEEEGK